VTQATERENPIGPQPNQPSQYPDAQFGCGRYALHLWVQLDRRIGAVIGCVQHICPCPWRWWRPRWRWLPWRRFSRRGSWAWFGPGPLSVLRRILSLLRRRRRLLCGSAARHDALRLANTPRLGLRMIATPPGLGAPRAEAFYRRLSDAVSSLVAPRYRPQFHTFPIGV